MVRKNNSTRKLTKADRKEFMSLVKANMKRAYFTALGLTGSHDMAMEVSQEVFLRVYKNFSTVRTKNNYIITRLPDMTTR